jgi:hypothetical protein
MNLLEEAKLKYPVGTKFRVVGFLHDIRTVKNHYKYEFVKDDIINFFTEETTSDCNGAMVYKDGVWAEIISLPKRKTVKVNKKDNYIINLFKKLKIK